MNRSFSQEKKFSREQVLTVEELLNGKKLQYPKMALTTFKKAESRKARAKKFIFWRFLQMIFHLIKRCEIISNSTPLSLRCPSCRQIGTFQAVHEKTVLTSETVLLGQRICPNPKCRAHIFVVWKSTGEILISYPPEIIDFDSTNIPPKIIKTFEEALTCHANQSFVAAAIMIRRTLDELCADKNAEGRNLKDRVQALGNKVILPLGLLKGLDNLRLLGNDAAHVEAKDYDNIGEDEVEVAADVTKEVLKAVYQLDNLVDRLEKLKRP